MEAPEAAQETVQVDINTNQNDQDAKRITELGTTDYKILRTVITSTAFAAGVIALGGAGPLPIIGRRIVIQVTAEMVLQCKMIALVGAATNQLLGTWQKEVVKKLGNFHVMCEHWTRNALTALRNFEGINFQNFFKKRCYIKA